MKSAFFLSLFCFALAGCATAPKISPQQRRALQIRSFDGVKYDHVFKAFKTVLQDEGYIIKNQDMRGGLIVAQASRTHGAGYAILAGLAGSQNYPTGQTFEVSVNLDEIKKGLTETRVIIQKTSSYSMGGSHGREIFSPELYKNIYSKVSVEIERRKAQGK